MTQTHRKLGLAAILAASGGSTLLACQWVAGIHEFEATSSEGTEAGARSGSDSGSAVDATTSGRDGAATDAGGADADAGACFKELPPQPIADPSVPGSDGVLRVFAFKTFSFLGEQVAGTVGYDIDGVWTGKNDAGSSCVLAAGTSLAAVADLHDTDRSMCGAIDNQFSIIGQGLQTIPTFQGQSLDTVAGVQARIDQGIQTVLFEIVNYNGTANDDQVNLYVATTEQLQSTGCVGSTVNDAPDAALFDGCDKWTIDEQAYNSADELKYGSTVAYVVDSQLVAIFAGSVDLPFGPAKISGGSPVVTATLETLPDGGLQVVDGQIQARLPTASFLAAMGTLYDPVKADNNLGLCEASDAGFYKQIKAGICANRDIMQSSGDDNRGLRCDSTSFVATFTATGALIGNTAPEPPFRYPNGCDGAPDDCDDLLVDGGAAQTDAGDD